VHLDHFLVLAEGKRDELAVEAPFEEGAELQLSLGEVGLHDPRAGIGRLDGFDVCVADAASLVGKKVKVRIERVLDGTAYAILVRRTAKAEEPITAEREAEKPTRARASAKKATAAAVEPEPEPPAEEAPETDQPAAEDGAAEVKPKKRTRRGSRGGRGRKKKAAEPAAENGAGDAQEAIPAVARIHVPEPDLGAALEEPVPTEAPAEDGTSPDGGAAKRKTRRGTRGGRNRKRRTVAAAAEENGGDATTAAGADGEAWEYVPMSEWGDEIAPNE